MNMKLWVLRDHLNFQYVTRVHSPRRIELRPSVTQQKVKIPNVSRTRPRRTTVNDFYLYSDLVDFIIRE